MMIEMLFGFFVAMIDHFFALYDALGAWSYVIACAFFACLDRFVLSRIWGGGDVTESASAIGAKMSGNYSGKYSAGRYRGKYER